MKKIKMAYYIVRCFRCHKLWEGTVEKPGAQCPYCGEGKRNMVIITNQYDDGSVECTDYELLHGKKGGLDEKDSQIG